MRYLDGTQVILAATRREIPRLVTPTVLVGDDIVGGSHPIKKPGLILGEDPVYTDSATVTSVQKQLYKLSVATSTPSLDPGTIDGKVGPHTNAAVAVFNTKYGWPTDGSKITAGTLDALKRPDVVDPAGYAAQQAALDAAAATTPAQVQAAAAKLSASVTPEIQAAATAAHAMALAATTPAQVQAAKAQVQAVAAQQVKAGASDTPWGTIALLGGLSVVILGGLVVLLKKSGPKSRVSLPSRRPAPHYRTLYASRSRR